jgi:hypothetical protein
MISKNKETEFRRYVKYMIANMINAELDAGVDFQFEARDLGVTEQKIVAEMRRQAALLYQHSLGR